MGARRPVRYGAMSERFLFLSDEWIAKATELKSEAEERFGDRVPEPPAAVRINIRINEIPHRTDLDGHIDSTGGRLVILEGWLDAADVTITTDYLTAAELFVAAGPEEFMEAMMPAVFRGRILIEGDLALIMPLMQQQAIAGAEPPPELREIGARLASFTEV